MLDTFESMKKEIEAAGFVVCGFHIDEMNYWQCNLRNLTNTATFEWGADFDPVVAMRRALTSAAANVARMKAMIAEHGEAQARAVRNAEVRKELKPSVAFDDDASDLV